MVEDEKEKEEQDMEEQNKWERNKSWRVEEVRKEGVLDRGLARSPSTKGRKRDQEGGRTKKLKHPVMEDDWGGN